MAQVVLVLSGKGGVGKSTVCACLSKALTQLGKRVLCIDADIGFRSLDLIMNVGTAVVYNWLDVMNESCNAFSAVAENEDGVSLLAAPYDCPDGIQAEDFARMLEKYSESFDYILIDAPAGSGKLHETLASVCDTLLLVATTDPVCVRSAETAISRALRVNEAAQTKMIINRFNKLEVLAGRQLKLDEVIDATRTQLVGVIPESDSVRLICSGEGMTKYAYSAFMRTARRFIGESVAFNIKDFY